MSVSCLSFYVSVSIGNGAQVESVLDAHPDNKTLSSRKSNFLLETRASAGGPTLSATAADFTPSASNMVPVYKCTPHGVCVV